MTQDMRRDGLLLEGGTVLSGPLRMLVEQVGEAGTCHGSTLVTDEEFGRCDLPRTASHARTSSAVCCQSGSARCRRPLPWMWSVGVGCQVNAVSDSESNSATRKPAAKHTCIMARSRRPARVWISGALRMACISATDRWRISG